MIRASEEEVVKCFRCLVAKETERAAPVTTACHLLGRENISAYLEVKTGQSGWHRCKVAFVGGCRFDVTVVRECFF